MPAAKMELIAGAAPNLVRVASADGRCTLCNPVWLRFTGRALDQELAAGWMASTPTTGRACTRRTPPRRAAIAVDKAQLYRTAVDASSAKDEFLATISHELRTPMTATLGWVRMFNMGVIEPEMERVAMEAIERSTLAQAKLIDDILDVSSVVLGKFRMESQPVDLSAAIGAAIETLGPPTGAKSIRLDVDLSGWTGALRGNASRLQQVVWNLVSNSIKFGRRDGRIEVCLDRIGSTARLTVRDDGEGIDPRFLPHVFDRFRQGDTGMNRIHGGLGLGLAIVRHLVELHGGSVRAESDGVGQGATFTVELPAA